MRRILIAALAVALVATAAALADTRSVDATTAARLILHGAPGSGAGFSVAQLGDVNGDGRPDVAIGAPFRALPDRPNAGTVYVVFGSAATGSVDLDALGASGFAIVGGKNFRAGYGVAGVGDVNGDGRPDVLLMAPRKNGYKVPGSAFVVFGKADATTVDLAQLTPAQGFEIDDIPPYPTSTPDDVAGPGDVNGDGYADLLLTQAYPGTAAVVYGGPHPSDIDLRHLGRRGFRLTGAALNGGPTVAAAGDVNRDGRPDLLLGAPKVKLPGRRFPANSAFVIFGRRSSGTVDLRRLGSRGFRIGGLVPGGIVRPPVAGIGDVNGDHRADVAVVGYPNGSADQHPAATVIFGSRSTRTVDASHPGARGFRIRGERVARGSGTLGPVAGLGDLNGDRVPDLGLGSSIAPRAASPHSQSAFVVFGRRATSTLSLDDLGTAGYRLAGPASSSACETRFGAALAPAGDFDGDGHPDLLVGAPGFDCAGEVLVIPAP